ncbi:OmpH family outer membrane protein [Lutimonas vermicola]|uniref:OmpH family outer membrane protein n=1 Tax=Lutimonas vermicola TaxID=414288 RepID=A0ABU9L114_9FLAO
MKLFRNLFVVIALLTAFNTVEAQNVAHIDSEQLLMAMPETKAMETELKKVQQTYADEYNAQATALQAKLQKYDQEAPTQTDAKNEERRIEVEGLKQKIQKYAQTADQEIQKKRFDLLKPIVEKAQKAVSDVATEKGVKYVLDSSPGKGLIVFEGEDLMPSVKSKLGIQ